MRDPAEIAAVSRTESPPGGERRAVSFKFALGMIAGVWLVSDTAYYLLLPMLGLRSGYTAEPVAIALYYAAWIAATLPLLWPLYRPWPTAENPALTHIILIGLLGGIVLFAIYGLPALPPIVWTESWEAPELMRVTPWYFVPKAVEILFQQLLVTALVLALAAQGHATRTISFVCALLFGGMHVLLAFGGMPLGYVVRFIVAASLFGFVFPQLLLRVPNGLALCYALHWLYYLVTIIMAHTLSPYAH